MTITNFKSDFRNGLVWCAILHSYDHSCLDFNSLSVDTEEDMVKNHALAFKVGEERFKIDPLLDAEDMLTGWLMCSCFFCFFKRLKGKVPDARVVMTYLSQMHKYLKDLEPEGNPYYRDFQVVMFCYHCSLSYIH